MVAMPWRSLAWTLLVALPLAAQKPAAPAAADAPAPSPLQQFLAWLKDYRAGAFRLVKDGRTDEAALQQVDALMGEVAKSNDLPAAKLLFEAAAVEPHPEKAKSSAETIDFYR